MPKFVAAQKHYFLKILIIADFLRTNLTFGDGFAIHYREF